MNLWIGPTTVKRVRLPPSAAQEATSGVRAAGMSGRGGMPEGLPGEASRSEEDRARGFGGGGWSFSEYMAHKRSGLDEQYASRVVVETSALAGCVVHVDGATSTPKDSLAELVHRHGGRYAQYPESGMTHFVVNVLPIAKVSEPCDAAGGR